MRVVVIELISLDGVVQAPGGEREDLDGGFRHGGWSLPYLDPDTMGPVFDETIDGAAALLFGRRTYETMAGAWPQSSGDPFVERLGAIPKLVASRTLARVRRDLAQHHAAHG